MRLLRRKMRHGRAVMPFGKHRGVQVRLLQDDYLSFLNEILEPAAESFAPHQPPHLWTPGQRWCPCVECRRVFAVSFGWLHASVKAELRHRGFYPEYDEEQPTETGRSAGEEPGCRLPGSDPGAGADHCGAARSVLPIQSLGEYVCDHDYCDLEECNCSCHARSRPLGQAKLELVAKVSRPKRPYAFDS